MVQQEADEDLRKFSTSGEEINFDTNPFISTLKRLPWFIILLFIGLISGGIIERFESTLEGLLRLLSLCL